eukprot:TRINITY_DN1948_c0_g1_i3.p2 TRINITY_DN1948_c0_g1~~TRINITY_DN1948_c0_g1_i3.p2  ORF type:complete len:130 (+),score=23.30 TRINITY_DN1948_c0_g1_i3:108-497(+)
MLQLRLEHGETYFPEIEYIVYDVKQLGEPGTIEPHTDNQSQVSMVILLSDPREFAGGQNFFESGAGNKQDSRSVKLQLGDAVFFYGDKCEHWISPVTAGRRIILQMEISRGWPLGGLRGIFEWLSCKGD